MGFSGRARTGGASSADIAREVNAYLTANPPSGGPPLKELNAFIATAAGVQEGAARVIERYDHEFTTYLQTTAAAPRIGFVIPANTALVDVRNVRTGASMFANFDADGTEGGRRYVYDRNLRAGRQVIQIRTRDA